MQRVFVSDVLCHLLDQTSVLHAGTTQHSKSCILSL